MIQKPPIIPAMDLIENHCVRLEKGNFSVQTRYNANPLSVAQSFERAGCKRLHLVDLDGAKSGKVQHWHILKEIAANSNLHIDFSGGLRSEADLKKAFDLSAAQISIGTLAQTKPDLVKRWLEKYGSERFIIALDTRDGFIVSRGWQDSNHLSVENWLKENGETLTEIMITDVSRDGMLTGPATELYAGLLEQFPRLKLIASGGVGSMEHIHKLQKLALHGIIVGRALYEGKIKLEEIC
ncbi:MAG TPA: 1-(5-phosphoribosyl)-5-[(5-phosphoribosylamino)methylideneamino] imidazole-4-carboxamide isomerase [Candidatus Marinimicrobia bacterium]|nr:1-(5-phosphoribosyl)-5-[(5-phosphoribosylamino)methylideneamino] imidazole-4-carboxamide isomerase [Candidatus Neomarinimicrobiota bacterium]